MNSGRQQQRSAAQIESDIARTRAALDRTAEALLHELDTRHLFARGLDMIVEAVGGPDEFKLSEAIRANSIPLALIGLGVGWLLAGNTGVIDAVARDERVVAARQRLGQMSREAGKVVGVTSELTSNPPDSERRDNGWVHHASAAARDAIRSVGESSGAVQVRQQVAEVFARHPLLIGVVGILAGAGLAALVPATRIEDEWLGETGTNMRNGAHALAREAVERVRNIADERGR